MAELKRAFTQPGINRDLDDRLLPDGMYRDGLNVNVGRSEGDDVGALENTKGNEIVPGQGDVLGTTIGTVVDPANDRLYWFTTDDAQDAIYEYDGVGVNTVIIDNRFNTIPLPTCVPELQAFITGPDSGRPADPVLPAINPVVSVSATSGTAQSPNSASATFTANVDVDGSNTDYTYRWSSGESTQTITVTSSTTMSSISRTVTVNAADGGTAMATGTASITITDPPPPPPDMSSGPTVTITGATSATAGGTVTLGLTEDAGTSSDGTGLTITGRQWTIDGTNAGTGTTQDVTSATADTVTVGVTITNSAGDTATDTHDIVFGTQPVHRVTFTTNTPTNTSVVNNPAFVDGVSGTNFSFTSIISPNTGFEFVGNPIFTVPSGQHGVIGQATATVTGTIGNMDLDLVGGWTATTMAQVNSFTIGLRAFSTNFGGSVTTTQVNSMNAGQFNSVVTPTQITADATNRDNFITNSVVGTQVTGFINSDIADGTTVYMRGFIDSTNYNVAGTKGTITVFGTMTQATLTITALTEI